MILEEPIIDTLGGVNIYLNNNENENAIFNLLKFKNHYILQKLKETYELNYTDQFKTNNGETLSEYIVSQIKNHKENFTNNMDEEYNQIKYFVKLELTKMVNILYYLMILLVII